jgi:hypothetical protein
MNPWCWGELRGQRGPPPTTDSLGRIRVAPCGIVYHVVGEGAETHPFRRENPTMPEPHVTAAGSRGTRGLTHYPPALSPRQILVCRESRPTARGAGPKRTQGPPLDPFGNGRTEPPNGGPVHKISNFPKNRARLGHGGGNRFARYCRGPPPGRDSKS